MSRLHMDDCLLQRTVKNIGRNKVTLSPDTKFKSHVERHGKHLINETTINPNETKIIDNWYVWVHTDDNKPAKLIQSFPKHLE